MVLTGSLLSLPRMPPIPASNMVLWACEHSENHLYRLQALVSLPGLHSLKLPFMHCQTVLGSPERYVTTFS